MVKEESSVKKICDFRYLTEMMGGKKPLIAGIMNTFLTQIPEEINGINDGIARTNYPAIMNFSHNMRSTVSIMGIAVLKPILQEMENLAKEAMNMDKIKELNQKVNSLCTQAIEEIEKEKFNYV